VRRAAHAARSPPLGGRPAGDSPTPAAPRPGFRRGRASARHAGAPEPGTQEVARRVKCVIDGFSEAAGREVLLTIAENNDTKLFSQSAGWPGQPFDAWPLVDAGSRFPRVGHRTRAASGPGTRSPAEAALRVALASPDVGCRLRVPLLRQASIDYTNRAAASLMRGRGDAPRSDWPCGGLRTRPGGRRRRPTRGRQPCPGRPAAGVPSRPGVGEAWGGAPPRPHQGGAGGGGGEKGSPPPRVT